MSGDSHGKACRGLQMLGLLQFVDGLCFKKYCTLLREKSSDFWADYVKKLWS